jgi:predicted metal-dependent phosphoesterase TrpH
MTIPNWRVELHAHTIYSKDSLLRLEDLPEICRRRGIDKLAITDHNTASGALQAARAYPMLIIPGEEVMTTAGELLAWYVSETVPAGLAPLEAIERLRMQGAVIGVAHPFDRYRRGAWELEDLLTIVDLIDCIEVHNARCLHDEDNAQALAFAQEHGKLMTVGSDAHVRREYGRAVVTVPPFGPNGAALREALTAASLEETRRSGLGVHFGSTYAKWVKKVFPALRAPS